MSTVVAAKSIMDTEAVRALVSAEFDLGQARACTLLQSRNNDVYRVDLASRSCVLKVYRRGLKKESELCWENDLLVHLAARGVAAPVLVPGRRGLPFVAVPAAEGDRLAVLYELVPGHQPTAGDAGMYRVLGGAVGALYDAADGLRSRHEARTLHLDRVIRQGRAFIRRALADRPEDLGPLVHLLDDAERRLADLIAAGLDWGVCHGDISLENMHIQADGGIVLVDFENAGYGFRAADLCGFRHDLVDDPDGWDAFVEGYRAHRPLGPAEAAALDWMLVPFWLYNLRWLTKAPRSPADHHATDDLSRAVRVLTEWAEVALYR